MFDRVRLPAFGLVIASALASPAAASDAYPAIWTGAYIGGHLGYAAAVDEPSPFDVDGFAIGIHGGYNQQFQQFLIGVEGDWTHTDASDTQTAPGGARVSLFIDDLASLRARAGFIWQNALIFGTVGWAWGQAGTSGSFPGLFVKQTTDFDGVVAGGGVEYKFDANWSGRIEGLRYWLEPDNPNSADLDVDVVRAGLTYHFR